MTLDGRDLQVRTANEVPQSRRQEEVQEYSPSILEHGVEYLVEAHQPTLGRTTLPPYLPRVQCRIVVRNAASHAATMSWVCLVQCNLNDKGEMGLAKAESPQLWLPSKGNHCKILKMVPLEGLEPTTSSFAPPGCPKFASIGSQTLDLHSSVRYTLV